MEPILTVENLTKNSRRTARIFRRRQYQLSAVSRRLPCHCRRVGLRQINDGQIDNAPYRCRQRKNSSRRQGYYAGNGKITARYLQKMQMVFQFPQDSFNPHQKLDSAIIEPLINGGMSKTKARKHLPQLLNLVGLNYSLVDGRYARELSGGQCQRAALARALAVKPEILICDEATSALDVISQKQIVDLLQKLQRDFNLSLILITHDLTLVQQLCSRVLVMYQGKIIEENTTEQIINNPQQEYTKLLIRSTI